MIMVVVGLTVGWFLCSVLLHKLSFLLAWLLVASLGIAIDVFSIRKKGTRETIVGFWFMVGALGPIYLQVLEMF